MASLAGRAGRRAGRGGGAAARRAARTLGPLNGNPLLGTMSNYIGGGTLGGVTRRAGVLGDQVSALKTWNHMNARRPAARARAWKPGVMPTPPPMKNKASFARHGKTVAAAVAGAGALYGISKGSTGRAVDPSMGTPRGIYGY